MARRLEVELIGDASSLERAFGRGSKSASGFHSKLAAVGRTAAIGRAGGIAVGAVATKAFINAAREAEVSQSLMENALKNSGISYKANAKQIEDVIQSTSKLAALDDEDLQGAFTRLVRTTGSVNTALRDTKIAADVARGAHLSLEAATKVVQKAQMGSVASLKRLGIEVPKVTSAMDALKASHEKATDTQVKAATAADAAATKQAAIAALQRKFAGDAEAYGSSSAAAGERFHVAVENLEEALGKKLLPALASATNFAAEFIVKVSESETLKAILEGVGATVKAVADFIKANWGTVTTVFDAVSRAVEATAGAVRENWGKISATFETVKGIVLGAVSVMIALWERFGGDITRIVQAAFQTISAVIKGALDVIRGIVNVVLGLIHGDWDRAWKGVQQIVSGALSAISGLLRGAVSILGAVAHAIGSAILDGIKAGAAGILDLIKGVVSGILGAIRGAVEGAFNAMKSFGEALVRGIRAGLSAFGSAIVELIKAPINAVIGSINALKIPAISIDTHIPHIGKISTPEIDPIPYIPTLAKGGIAFGPTLAMIGERGPEAVVPLGQRGGFGLASAGGGLTVNLTVQGALLGSSVPEVTDTIYRELLRRMKRNGTLGFT